MRSYSDIRKIVLDEKTADSTLREIALKISVDPDDIVSHGVVHRILNDRPPKEARILEQIGMMSIELEFAIHVLRRIAYGDEPEKIKEIAKDALKKIAKMRK